MHINDPLCLGPERLGSNKPDPYTVGMGLIPVFQSAFPSTVLLPERLRVFHLRRQVRYEPSALFHGRPDNKSDSKFILGLMPSNRLQCYAA